MAGTYTPSQTWHNNGQYVLTGEVITESIAKELGAFAMDNVARLVGTAAGATPQAIRRLATVADVAAVKAIGASDRADQDYVGIDSANGERWYKFDSASGATGDDFAVITPTAGTGRWHMVGCTPKTSTKRWVVPGAACSAPLVGATSLPIVGLAAAATAYIANTDATGATLTVYAFFSGFNVGDVLSEIEVVGSLVNAAADVTATFFLISAVDGATAAAVTNMGAVSSPAGAGAFSVSLGVGPYTVPQPTDNYTVVAEIVLTNQAGTTQDAKLFWVAINGTRTYITE